MKLGTLNQLFYNNWKRRMLEEELNTFGFGDDENPIIDVFAILDEHFEMEENNNAGKDS